MFRADKIGRIDHPCADASREEEMLHPVPAWGWDLPRDRDVPSLNLLNLPAESCQLRDVAG